MDTKLFQDIGKIIKARRPLWQCIMEDEKIRILTHQFIVDWGIINEIVDMNYEILEVTLHQQYGVVITLQSKLGT